MLPSKWSPPLPGRLPFSCNMLIFVYCFLLLPLRDSQQVTDTTVDFRIFLADDADQQNELGQSLVQQTDFMVVEGAALRLSKRLEFSWSVVSWIRFFTLNNPNESNERKSSNCIFLTNLSDFPLFFFHNKAGVANLQISHNFCILNRWL